MDTNSIGQDKGTKDVVTAYDAEKGTWKDDIHKLPEDTKLPSGQMPKGPDPDPFKLGPMAAGGR